MEEISTLGCFITIPHVMGGLCKAGNGIQQHRPLSEICKYSLASLSTAKHFSKSSFQKIKFQGLRVLKDGFSSI